MIHLPDISRHDRRFENLKDALIYIKKERRPVRIWDVETNFSGKPATASLKVGLQGVWFVESRLKEAVKKPCLLAGGEPDGFYWDSDTGKHPWHWTEEEVDELFFPYDYNRVIDEDDPNLVWQKEAGLGREWKCMPKGHVDMQMFIPHGKPDRIRQAEWDLMLYSIEVHKLIPKPTNKEREEVLNMLKKHGIDFSFPIDDVKYVVRKERLIKLGLTNRDWEHELMGYGHHNKSKKKNIKKTLKKEEIIQLKLDF